jgi:hypothetical protein
MNPRVKIYCIRSVAEAALAICHGVAALGLVSGMSSGPGVIGEGLAANSQIYPSPYFCVASSLAGSAS